MSDDFHYRKPGKSFNLHVKKVYINRYIIYTANKETLNFQLKRRADFWIKKPETVTPKELNK